MCESVKPGTLTHGGSSLSFARQVSTVEQPPALWKSEMDATKMANAGISPGLIRYSAGIGSPDDLNADLAWR